MKTLKKTLCLLLALVLLLCSAPAAFAEDVNQNLTWTLDAAGTLTISGEGPMYGASWGKYSDSIKTVVIGDGVTSIGESAFCGCTALESVTIPDSVTSIGSEAFENCTALESVTLPDGITSIRKYAFGPSYNDWYTLALCNKDTTTAATLAATEFLYAFLDGTDEDNLIQEKFNAKLTYTIDKRTRTLTVQNEDTMASFSAFTAPWQEYQAYITNVVILPGCTTVGSLAFKNCYNIKRVTLPDSMEQIDSSAFYNCKNLTTINLPHGLRIIGDNAFWYSGLKSIEFPATVTTIGDSAFEYSRLESILIPDTVTSLGWYAFEGCASLKTAEIGNGIKSIPWDAFRGCSSLETVTVGDNVQSVGNNAFAGCSSLHTVVLPERVTSIKNGAFSNKAIKDIYIYSMSCTIDESAIYPSATIHGYLGSTAETFAYSLGYSFEPLTAVIAHEHDQTPVPAVAPTCTESGLTEGCRCSVCGKWITRQKTVKALGHDYQPTETVLPTDTEPGHIRYECTRCHEGYTEVVPVSSHEHSFTVIENREATCLEDGYITRVCYGCGYSYTEILEAPGHTFGAWKTFLPVEVGQAGIDVRFCTVCGVYELRESENTNPADPGHEHSFVLIESKAPDCENAGYKRYLCTCGTGKAEITDALGHDMQLGECVLETCTTGGYTPWVCTRCGKETRTDLVPAKGHQWDGGKVTLQPTCSNFGIMTYTCTREGCGETMTKELGKDPNGHVYNVTVYEPTCVDEGYTSHACTLCRYGYSDNIVPALGHIDANSDGECDRCGTPTGTGDPCANGHDLGDWITRSEPTCTQKGYKSKYCSRCKKAVETQEIAALGHDFKVDQSKSRAATCTEEGFQKKICTRCGNEEDTTLQKLGHVDENGDGKCDRCKEKLTDADEEKENLNFFQRIIQWFKDLFAKMFGKK